MSNRTPTSTWPDLAIGLYDQLTSRNAEIAYEFDDMQVAVPSGTGSPENAKWMLSGTLRIRTRNANDS